MDSPLYSLITFHDGHKPNYVRASRLEHSKSSPHIVRIAYFDPVKYGCIGQNRSFAPHRIILDIAENTLKSIDLGSPISNALHSPRIGRTKHAKTAFGKASCFQPAFDFCDGVINVCHNDCSYGIVDNFASRNYCCEHARRPLNRDVSTEDGHALGRLPREAAPLSGLDGRSLAGLGAIQKAGAQMPRPPIERRRYHEQSRKPIFR